MASLVFTYTSPGSGSKSEECISFDPSAVDYDVIYEDILGYGTIDKEIGPKSGMTLTATIRINEVDFITTYNVANAWKALINYRGTVEITPIGSVTPLSWQRMRLTEIGESKTGPINRFLELTFKQMAA